MGRFLGISGAHRGLGGLPVYESVDSDRETGIAKFPDGKGGGEQREVERTSERVGGGEGIGGERLRYGGGGSRKRQDKKRKAELRGGIESEVLSHGRDEKQRGEGDWGMESRTP
mmetsp:Transcript_26223/g.73517  ORF Transcript_26223/g.73517 Transcript_26223/m.73517 type:complete len:114 (+) Transcript_26223:3368-3709(+)